MALPKTTDPSLPMIGGMAYIGDADAQQQVAIAAGQYFRNASGLWVPVSTADPLPGQLEADAAAVKVAPVTGVRTVTATAAELFAGASRLNGRRMMLIRNESTSIRIRVGGPSVTQQNGFPVEPGAVLQLQFHPSVAVVIYAISEGAAVDVAVMEW